MAVRCTCVRGKTSLGFVDGRLNPPRHQDSALRKKKDSLADQLGHVTPPIYVSFRKGRELPTGSRPSKTLCIIVLFAEIWSIFLGCEIHHKN